MDDWFSVIDARCELSAGAAEDIIGETLGDQSTFALLKVKLCADFNLSEKVA